MNDDPASILFPSDVPAHRAAPDWYRSKVAGAESRLMGRHSAQDAASVLFPNDATTSPQNTARRPQPRPEKSESEVAAELFKGDRPADEHAKAVADVFKPLADDARLSGDHGRADELEEATASLAGEFAKAGTDPGTVAEVMQLAKEALGDTVTGPVEPERLAEMEAAAYAWIAEAGITDAELSAARRMIDDLEAATGGIKAYLGDTGLGNNPKMIAAAIREARRRGYR